MKREFKVLARRDKDVYYNKLADDVQQAMSRNDLRPAFRSVRLLGFEFNAHGITYIDDIQGHSCKSADAVQARWVDYYKTALNYYPPATQNTEFDAVSASNSEYPDTHQQMPQRLTRVEELSRD